MTKDTRMLYAIRNPLVMLRSIRDGQVMSTTEWLTYLMLGYLKLTKNYCICNWMLHIKPDQRLYFMSALQKWLKLIFSVFSPPTGAAVWPMHVFFERIPHLPENYIFAYRFPRKEAYSAT